MWSRCKVTEIFIGSEFTTRRPGRSKSLGEFFEKRSVKGLDPKIWISKWVPFCCHWWILTACFPAISKLWSLLFIINLLVTSYSKSIAPLDYQLRHENLSSVVFCGSEPEFQRWHIIPSKWQISTHQAPHLWYWWSPRLIPRIFWTPTPLSALETSKVRRSGIQTRLTHVQLSWNKNFVQKIGRVIFSLVIDLVT